MKHDRPVLGERTRGGGPREAELGQREEREEQRGRGARLVQGGGVGGWFPAISTPGPRNVPTLTKKKK